MTVKISKFSKIPLRFRLASVLLFAFLLSFGITFAHGAIAPVGACGWGVERSVQNRGGTNYLNDTLTTWNDGCGNREYENTIWLSYTSSDTHSQLRAWVCGTYEGEFTTTGVVAWSGTYYYGGCGRQATNQYAYVYLPYNGGNVFANYENQG